MAKLDKAPVYETGDYRFESCRVHHYLFRSNPAKVVKMSHPEEQPQSQNDQSVKFRGWRLLGYLMSVIVVLAIIAGLVDILVIGPLDGRL